MGDGRNDNDNSLKNLPGQKAPGSIREPTRLNWTMLMETRAYILPLTLLGQGIERRTVDNGVFHLGPSEVTARKLLFFFSQKAWLNGLVAGASSRIRPQRWMGTLSMGNKIKKKEYYILTIRTPSKDGFLSHTS